MPVAISHGLHANNNESKWSVGIVSSLNVYHWDGVGGEVC